jgi:hypothetical protein
MTRRNTPAAARQAARPTSANAAAGTASRAPRHDGLTLERQHIFLDALASTGSVGRAAKACGVSRQALYAYRNRDDVPAFREAWEVAIRCAIDQLSDIAFERAVEGVEEPVYWKGEQIGTRRRYNDNLLMAILRARNPFAFCMPSQMGPVGDVRRYATRPRLPGVLDDVAREVSGEAPAPHYDDDPGGPLNP